MFGFGSLTPVDLGSGLQCSSKVLVPKIGSSAAALLQCRVYSCSYYYYYYYYSSNYYIRKSLGAVLSRSAGLQLLGRGIATHIQSGSWAMPFFLQGIMIGARNGTIGTVEH